MSEVIPTNKKEEKIPESGEVDFVSGLKTVAGSGDPMLREGLATHVYVDNNNLTCLHKQGPEFGLNVECSLLWNNEKFTIGG
jgi:hypothetical protein